MDRSDEIKHNVLADDVVNSNREERAGDILGLGNAPVPKMPGDPSADDDPEAVAQRRARLRSGESEGGVSGDTVDRPSGATGIDMGAGGSGTGVTGS